MYDRKRLVNIIKILLIISFVYAAFFFYYLNNRSNRSRHGDVKAKTAKLKFFKKNSKNITNVNSNNSKKSSISNYDSTSTLDSASLSIPQLPDMESEFNNSRVDSIKLDYSQLNEEADQFLFFDNKEDTSHKTYEEKLKDFFRFNLELPQSITNQVIESILNFENELLSLNNISDPQLRLELSHQITGNYEKYLIQLMNQNNYRRFHLWNQRINKKSED